jgi:AraC-like DNA-binding protein
VTAAIQNVRMVVAAAAVRGIPPGKLLTAIGLDPQVMIASDGRIPAELALRAWQVAAELSGDPWFGLSAVEHLSGSYLGGLGFAFHGSATLGDALRRLARFFQLVNQYASLEVIEDGGLARVRIALRADIAAEQLRHPTECLLAVVLTIARHATGAELQPTAVAFRHAAPPELSAYHRVFGVTPCFDQPWHELVLDIAALDRPLVAPDHALVALAERHLQRRASELPPVETFTGRVRRTLLEELELGEPTLPKLAARLRMSERTLQRRLGCEGTSMQALLDEVRRQLSIRRLAESTQSIAEISYALGFAEVRAFHRAFKRWTGSTPAAYRQSRAAS